MTHHNNSTNERIVSDSVYWLYPCEHPPPTTQEVLLLTKGGVTTRGYWKESDCMAWLPFPKRDKLKEKCNG